MNTEKIANLKIELEKELGYSLTYVKNTEVFAVVLKQDFDRALPTKFVRDVNELETIQLDWSEKDRFTNEEVLAKAIVDGLWAHQRAINYSNETRNARKTVQLVDRQAEDRLKYNKLVSGDPTLLDDPEKYLPLQRSYGLIDQQTYEMLLKGHRKLVAEAKAAYDKVMQASQNKKAA
jgi:hypothetical protein